MVLTYQVEESLATSTDFFAALDEIGMARDMGSGLSIYRLRLGERATTDDLRRMFEANDIVEPATIKDQRAFYDRWLESLKG